MLGLAKYKPSVITTFKENQHQIDRLDEKFKHCITGYLL